MKVNKTIDIYSRLTQLAYVDYRLSEYVLGSIFRHIVSLNTYVECLPISELLSETQYLVLGTRNALATKYIETFYEYEDFTESATSVLSEQIEELLKRKKRLRKRRIVYAGAAKRSVRDFTKEPEEHYEITTSLQRLEELVAVIDDWCIARNSSDENGNSITEIKYYVNQIVEFLTILTT